MLLHASLGATAKKDPIRELASPGDDLFSSKPILILNTEKGLGDPLDSLRWD